LDGSRSWHPWQDVFDPFGDAVNGPSCMSCVTCNPSTPLIVFFNNLNRIAGLNPMPRITRNAFGLFEWACSLNGCHQLHEHSRCWEHNGLSSCITTPLKLLQMATLEQFKPL
jgi:hypothetical protein